MNADAEAQLRLLEVQAHDTRLGQLRHKDQTMPERAALTDIETRLARVRDELVAAETIAADLALDQRKADADVEQVRDRAARDRQLLDSGSIGDPKQLQSLQAELVSLARRQGDLEDVELEIMERVEGAEAAVRLLSSNRDELEAERVELAARVDELRGTIATEASGIESERARLAQGLPADLLTLFDKLRADNGGVGAARLHRGRCEGCHLDLSPSEIDVVRNAAADEVLRCEECRRILIRTAESGL